MPTIKIDLPGEALDRLAELCVRERRSLYFQVEVQLLRSLGLWSDTPPTCDHPSDAVTPDHAAPHDR